MDYRETLNLPQTEFPMKAELNVREPEVQARWQEQDLYGQVRKHARNKPKFILHDGPPYANGDVHLGTAFNKISKDIIVKYKSMRGFDAPYVPGWDCHGMPIEHKVVGQLPEADARDRQRVRSECRKYAQRFVDHQRRQFKRLGVLGEWDQPYLTMDPEYQAAIVRVFGKLARQGFIYRGLKPVYWCIHCRSALAEAEVEYADHASPSITVRFELVSGWPAALGEKPQAKVFVPIWTTTPWTLPANRAVAVHPEFTYVLIESQGDYYFVAKERVAPQWEKMGRSFTVHKEISGRELAGLQLQHPFLSLQVPVILGGHVTLDAGTGCVHTAPGHGQEDYVVGLENGLEVFNPVGPDGRYTEAFPEMQGELVWEANDKLIERLRASGALLHVEKISHSYPHCWRHHAPIIFRATEQWFMKIDKDGFRQKLLDHIQKDVAWIPAVSQNRIASMVAGRPDWCLSRQRAWGVPVPVFYCTACGTPLMTEAVFHAVEQLVRQENADAWFGLDPQKFLPAHTRCEHCQATQFRQETDILDVWFDSGVSHAAVLQTRKELRFPADLYLEGSDQHRGWFQVSLITAAAITGQAPYKAVLTHGYTVDGDGRKMSKSLGNFISADEAIQRYGGADILRLWVSSENIQNDVRFSDEIFKRTVDTYRRIRNTLRFLLGNLNGFKPEAALKPKDQKEFDRLLLHRLQAFAAEATQACDAHEYFRYYQLLQNFCSSDLSAFYFDVLKDCLYADGVQSASRLSAQTTLWQVLRYLVRMIAPILVHTSEEVWSAMRLQGLLTAKEDVPSVHLAAWLAPETAWQDDSLAKHWDGLLEIRSEVMKKLEEARNQKLIGHAYEAAVKIKSRGAKLSLLAGRRDQLAALFVVSAVDLEETGPAGGDLVIGIEKAPWAKCDRCWRVLPSVGKSAEHPGLCGRCEETISLSAPKTGGKEKGKA